MRVTNVEKFRTELFENLKVAMFANCTKLSEARFERSHENGNLYECCALYDCLQVTDYTNPNKQFYLIVNDECDVLIFKLNEVEKCFKYVSTVGNYNSITKVQLMMTVAVELQRAMMR